MLSYPILFYKYKKYKKFSNLCNLESELFLAKPIKNNNFITFSFSFTKCSKIEMFTVSCQHLSKT